MGKVIALVNEKGGVSKTTTTKNLAIGLAMEGKKVLAVDLDPSGNLTKSLMRLADDDNGSICDILSSTMEFQDLPDGFGIVSQAEGIDLITSSSALRALEPKLEAALQRETVLRRYINTIKEKYDYIFLDCPAGLGIFTDNALFCADSLIIPLQPHAMAVEAMQNLFLKVNMVRKLNGTGVKPAVQGILFAQVRTNTNNDKSIMNGLRDAYSKNHIYIFDSYIPMASKIPESDGHRESIYKYASNSTAALNYSDLVKEFLKMEDNK